MFKLFHVDKKGILHEVKPKGGVYIVYELYEYQFIYESSEEIVQSVFIEDVLFDYKNAILSFTKNKIETRIKSRIFEDLFGYINLNISDKTYLIEVRITKLKVSELEDILLYLWNNNMYLFDNFFSKSTYKSSLTTNYNDLNFGSKLLNIHEQFCSFFEKKISQFKAKSHNKLKNKDVIEDYDIALINDKSIYWLLMNMDIINFDPSFINLENSIKLNSNYGLIEKILTEKKINSINVYENQIILGAFDFVLVQLNKFHSTIISKISKRTNDYQENYYSIEQFKTIPFIKLCKDVESLIYRVKKLQLKYKMIFKDVTPLNLKPRLTNVFTNHNHYREAYSIIKQIRDQNIHFDGQLNLININKISELYEWFNLYVIVDSILLRKPIEYKFTKFTNNIYKEYYFKFKTCEITIYYEPKICNYNNDNLGLTRISQGKTKDYYKPDYVINIKSRDKEQFYILDSKYSSEYNVKNIHLYNCIKKYILDIGILNEPSQKISELLLVYPGENERVIYGNDVFKPKISILPSKVNKNNLRDFVSKLFINT